MSGFPVPSVEDTLRASLFRILIVTLLVISQVSAALPTRGAAYHTRPARTGASAEIAAVTAGTVTDCSNDFDFDAKLVGGGSIDFDCGASTLELSSTKPILADTEIDGGNQIVLSGGGIVSYGTTSIRDSRFENNSGGGSGAFYLRHGAAAVIESTVFTGNQALSLTSGLGGAILIWDGPQVTIRDSHFEGNRADSGGAIYNLANSRLVMERTRFVANNARFSSGALFNAGEVRASHG